MCAEAGEHQQEGDGGASGLLRFKLTYRDMSKIFQLSPLTGRLLILEAGDAAP